MYFIFIVAIMMHPSVQTTESTSGYGGKGRPLGDLCDSRDVPPAHFAYCHVDTGKELLRFRSTCSRQALLGVHALEELPYALLVLRGCKAGASEGTHVAHGTGVATARWDASKLRVGLPATVALLSMRRFERHHRDTRISVILLLAKTNFGSKRV